jgi:hypothetical protein
MIRKSLCDKHFSLEKEDVVGQGSPLVENYLQKLQTCFLEEVEEKEAPFHKLAPWSHWEQGTSDRRSKTRDHYFAFRRVFFATCCI